MTGYEPGWLEAVFGQDTGDIGHHVGTLLLPAISLAAGLIAVYMRLLRSDMIATLQENYITMARAKGLSDRRILWRHALRPSSLTLLTVAGLNFGTLIGGAVAVEVIFAVPGLGHADLPGHQRPADRGAAELHRDHRHLLRAAELRHRRPLRGARPEDPAGPCLSDRCPVPGPARPASAIRSTDSSARPPAAACRSTPAPSRSPRSRPGPRCAAAAGAASASRAGCRSDGSCSWSGSRCSPRSCPIDDPKEITTEIARRGPFADAGTASGHLLGGDFNGRDMLSRLIWGGRTTLLVATAAVAIGFVLGGALGLVGGYFRGKVDVVVSGLLDVFLAIPAVILALALVVILRTQPGTDGGRHRSRPDVADPRHRPGVDPGARADHACEHPVVVGARVRARGARPGRDPPAHHGPRGAARTCSPRCSRSRCSASRWRSSPRAR